MNLLKNFCTVSNHYFDGPEVQIDSQLVKKLSDLMKNAKIVDVNKFCERKNYRTYRLFLRTEKIIKLICVMSLNDEIIMREYSNSYSSLYRKVTIPKELQFLILLNGRKVP